MEGYPVAIDVPVAWGDMDAFGHVNNTVYFRWFESARMALFEKLGVDVNRPESVGPILATTTCDYIAPVDYPATVRVCARVPSIGNSSFVMEYIVELDGAAVARGSGVIVMIDYRTGDKVRVADPLRDAITALG